MSEIQRIVDQLRRAQHGRAWHGPSLHEVLADVTAHVAAARVPGATHSIWQIVLHVGVWEDTALRWLHGESIAPRDVRDWPAPPDHVDQGSWQRAVESLANTGQRLREEIAKMEESRLDEPIAGGKFTIYQMLHGVVQHDLYHAGQIAILKKMQQAAR